MKGSLEGKRTKLQWEVSTPKDYSKPSSKNIFQVDLIVQQFVQVLVYALETQSICIVLTCWRLESEDMVAGNRMN